MYSLILKVCPEIVWESDMLWTFLSAGCEASYVWGCIGGWVNFTLDYPEPNETYTSIDVFMHEERIIQITQNDTWENKERFSVYHDAQNESLRVGIKPISQDDQGMYNFKLKQSHFNRDQKVKLQLGK